MSKYLAVCLPKKLLKIVDAKKGDIYTSRAEFVKQSIRMELERLERIKRIKVKK